MLNWIWLETRRKFDDLVKVFHIKAENDNYRELLLAFQQKKKTVGTMMTCIYSIVDCAIMSCQ